MVYLTGNHESFAADHRRCWRSEKGGDRSEAPGVHEQRSWIPAALEAAGIEFIGENRSLLNVWLRKRQTKKG